MFREHRSTAGATQKHCDWDGANPEGDCLEAGDGMIHMLVVVAGPCDTTVGLPQPLACCAECSDVTFAVGKNGDATQPAIPTPWGWVGGNMNNNETMYFCDVSIEETYMWTLYIPDTTPHPFSHTLSLSLSHTHTHTHTHLYVGSMTGGTTSTNASLSPPPVSLSENNSRGVHIDALKRCSRGGMPLVATAMQLPYRR